MPLVSLCGQTSEKTMPMTMLLARKNSSDWLKELVFDWLKLNIFDQTKYTTMIGCQLSQVVLKLIISI